MVQTYSAITEPGVTGLLADSPPIQKSLLQAGVATSLQNGDQPVLRLKDDVSRAVFVLAFAEGDRLLGKRYEVKGLAACLKERFFRSRAKEAHRYALRLNEIAVATPQSYGYLFVREGLLHYRVFHLSEYLEDAKTLEHILQNDVQLFRQYQDSLLKTFVSLHRQGFVHGDAKLSNLMLLGEKAYLIDLDGLGVASYRRRPERDIARLLVSAAELGVAQQQLLAFVGLYCERMRYDVKRFKERLKPFIERFQAKHLKKYQVTPGEIL